MRFVGVLFESFAAHLNQRVQLLRGLGHEIHCQRVALRLVVHVSERVNDVIKDRICAAEAPVCVLDLDAQCLKGSRRVLRAVLRLLHLVCDFLERVLDPVIGNADHVGGVLKFLNLLGALPGHAGKRLYLLRVSGGLLGDGHQLLLDLDDSCDLSSKAADCRRRSGVDAVEGVQRLAGALGQVDAQFIRRAADRVAKTDRFALAVRKGFLEVGKNALCACSFLLRLCDGVLDLLHRLLKLCPVRAGFLKRVVVFFQRRLHLFELCLCINQTGFPVDRALIGLAVGFTGFLEHFAQRVDLLLLRLHLPGEDVALGRQRLDAVSVICKILLRGAHLCAQVFKSCVDLGKGGAIFLLAVHFDFCVNAGRCHQPPPPVRYCASDKRAGCSGALCAHRLGVAMEKYSL